jgi:hypothetical protein
MSHFLVIPEQRWWCPGCHKLIDASREAFQLHKIPCMGAETIQRLEEWLKEGGEDGYRV